jgi:hypothetical protein
MRIAAWKGEVMADKKLNLHQKMHQIMKNVQYMKKDDSVEFNKTKYKAMSEEKVTSIMRQQIEEQGILVYPVEQTFQRTGNISHVDVKYRIVNADDPADFIEVVSCGDGADTQDKGSGKAMTYAFKYMWLRTFAIPTGEDPDKISSEELDAKQAEEEAIITAKEVELLKRMCARKGVESQTYKKKPVEHLTAKEYADAMRTLGKMPDVEGAA